MAYHPQTSYGELRRVESFIERSLTVEDLRYIAATEGSKIGYKALGRLIAGRMTPEEMKPGAVDQYQEQPLETESRPPKNGFSDQVDACLAIPGFFPEGKKPYDFQYDGIRFLACSRSALLGDEMGLGKTVQAIGALKVLYKLGKVGRVLILCPRSIVDQWNRELRNWAPELFTQKVRGSYKKRGQLWRSGAAVFIAGYESWRIDMERLLRQLQTFDLVILDEVQKIKNPETSISKSVRKTPADYRWGLSGTPLENKVDDVVAIYDYLNPALFRKNDPPYQPGLIRRLMSPYFLRRRVENVGLQLPDKVKNDVWLELLEEQRESYERTINGSRERLAKPHAKTTHVLAEISKLKQICNYDERSGTSCKLEYLTGELEKVVTTDQKALVFSQFPNKTLSSIENRLDAFYPALFHGGLSDGQREKLLSEFDRKPIPKVLLASLKTGGTGLNLTSANHVFHFDHWWNPAVKLQAEGRAYRIGQPRTVFVHSMFASDTVEEGIYQLLLDKQSLFDTVIDELSEEQVLGALTPKELFGLFDLEPPKPKTKKSKARVGYQPAASYQALKSAQTDFNRAGSVKTVRAAALHHGPRIGYKAICYILGELSTPEVMKGM